MLLVIYAVFVVLAIVDGRRVVLAIVDGRRVVLAIVDGRRNEAAQLGHKGRWAAKAVVAEVRCGAQDIAGVGAVGAVGMVCTADIVRHK